MGEPILIICNCGENLERDRFEAICLMDDSSHKIFGIHKVLPEPELPF